MKRFIAFIALILMFSTQITTNAYALGGIGQFFRGIIKLLKGSADDVIKTGDDFLKNMGKTKEEILAGTKGSKGINETILASGDEAKILETIGREEHSLHFASLKKSTRGKFR